ncbi:MAG TPA: hypothetical protein PLD12_08735 [Bacteroidales bacterium]|nr:hypothetical protein [Bacteroidales bacterium]HPO66063.1 hypothetical protein [Bacteroidales bacterium]
MRISGFSMGKDVTKLYYPVKESILSILPICDEFIFVLGKGDEYEQTRALIESIGSPKIKIYESTWDIEQFPDGTELAHQTDIAKSYCTGDWLFYIQADEVVHEKYLPIIYDRCKQLLNDREVEGLLFKYLHFWGDYNHYIDFHGWYKHEIRIIRNDPEIHSWRDAQLFRRIPNFDGKHYRQEENTFKLKVALVDAYIYHYGWVRPPSYMRSKMNQFNRIQGNANQWTAFDYGQMKRIPIFTGEHPAVMRPWIERFDWGHQLFQSGKVNKHRLPHKHERLKNRLVTFLEKKIFHRPLFEFRNYILLKNK